MTKECSHEPVVTLRGLSESGIEWYFRCWRSRKVSEAITWKVTSPEELHIIRLAEKQWHCRSAGSCKLHVKTAALVGQNILMMQPILKAWYKRAAPGRTTLVIALKVLVLTESGQLELPLNCAYADEEQARSKAIAVSAIQSICEKRYQLSSALQALAGNKADSQEMLEARRLEARETQGTRRRRLRGRALQAVRAWPTRDRSKPSVATIRETAGCQAAAEVLALRQKLAAVSAELKKTRDGFAKALASGTHNGVRKARTSANPSCGCTETEVAERNNEIALEQKLLAYEENDTLGKRRLANLSTTVESRAAEPRTRKTELKAQKIKLEDRKAQKLAAEEKSRQLRREVDTAKQLASSRAEAVEQLGKQLAQTAGRVEQIESNCEGTLHSVQYMTDIRISRANAREQKHVEQLAEERSTQYQKHVPMSCDAAAYSELSDYAKQAARCRDTVYACWFLEQRQWRAVELIIVMARQGCLEAVWECKAIWKFRMDWAHKLLASCTRTHWGVKLGL
eukprot:6178575-Pleurochrysis_carterae.AAC.9